MILLLDTRSYCLFMRYSVVIIGAGPAGLSCATALAESGCDVLVLERKHKVGPKVCAGGITWSGLIDTIPEHIEERRFPTQHIFTRLQRATITEDEPIIATVNRERLGQYMANVATDAGAVIRTSCQVSDISENELRFVDKESGREETVGFAYLVGADGSSSLVRRHLGLATEMVGIGINYQIPGHADNMEWHLGSKYFANGYGWIFPHAQSISIGAYVDRTQLSASRLGRGLIDWAGGRGYDLRRSKPRAETINFDYRGWKFDNIFLVGDAAGFASGLTGEGIYPAIVSGEHTGRYIADRKHDMKDFERLVRMQKLHARMVKLTGRASLLAEVMAELTTVGLRCGLLDFRKIEMAH